MNHSVRGFDQGLEVGEASIAVVGIGRMGRGIALSFAYAGYPVSLVDSEQRSDDSFNELVQLSTEELQAELDFLQSVNVISARQSAEILPRIRILPHQSGSDVLPQADFIFEAVSEVVAIKQSTYAWLSEVAGPHSIIASTTSTMLANTLAEFVQNPERFSNAHWLNPAYLMPLVEISPSQSTSDQTVSRLRALLEKIGKKPVVCAASPGYVVSRLQALVLNEAARLAEEGVASVEDIDTAVKVGFGIRYATLGPLEFADWGGGDILYHASNYLADNIDRERFAPADIVKHNMENSKNGLRDGVGFYDYRNRDVDAYRQERLNSFVGLLQHLDLMPNAKDAESD